MFFLTKRSLSSLKGAMIFLGLMITDGTSQDPVYSKIQFSGDCQTQSVVLFDTSGASVEHKLTSPLQSVVACKYECLCGDESRCSYCFNMTWDVHEELKIGSPCSVLSWFKFCGQETFLGIIWDIKTMTIDSTGHYNIEVTGGVAPGGVKVEPISEHLEYEQRYKELRLIFEFLPSQKT